MHKNLPTGTTPTAPQANPITPTVTPTIPTTATTTPKTATQTLPFSETALLPKPPTTPSIITKRIGGTTYQIAVHLSQTSKETMSDKITRMIRNDTTGKAAGL